MDDKGGLILEISKRDDCFSMCVFERREASSTVRHYSQCMVSLAEIDKLCRDVSVILNKLNLQADSGAELLKILTKTGQMLWYQLLTPQVRLRLNGTPLCELVLCLDEELMSIPWELLYNGSNFLCLNFNLGRTVRTNKQFVPMQYRSSQGALKMLILANPTDDLKGAYHEGVNIKNQFDRKSSSMRIDFKSTSIDRMYVKKNISDYDIVHFAGHCEYNPADPAASGWLLSDGRFCADDILAMGTGVSLPSLVFSNACHSAEVNLSRDYQGINTNLSTAFLLTGVRHYIGTVRKIEDPVSLVFAREFYTQLISGSGAGDCMRQGRLRLIKDYGITNLSWAGYLLYGDPEYVLFRHAAAAARSKVKKAKGFYKKIAAICALTGMAIACGVFLYLWLPSINPSTYYLYSGAYKAFLAGKNDRVMALIQGVIKKDPLYLPAYPLLADTYRRLGDKETALKYYFDYIRFSEKKGDKKNLLAAYIGTGWLYHLRGDYPMAYDFYTKALELCRKNSDKLNEADVLGKMAVWYMDKKDYDLALELLTKSAEINRQKPDSRKRQYNLACDYFNLGLLFAGKRDFAAAKEFYDKSFVLFRSLNLTYELSDYYFNVGEIYKFEKEYHKALDFYLKGLDIDTKQQNKWSLSSDYDMLGELSAEMGNTIQAEDYFKRALALATEIGAEPELASACRNLGRLYKARRKLNRARDYYRQAQEIYTRIDTSDYAEIKKELLNLSGD